MKTLKQTSQFKKDLKRIQNNPKEYKPHLLSGDYKGYMECHIESDFLLIWIDENIDLIKQVRLGSHSELFKKY